MKVRVKGFLRLREVLGEAHDQNLEMPEGSTLRDLMLVIGVQVGDRLREGTADLGTEAALAYCQVLVNGRHCRQLPGGLDAELHEHDFVALFPPVAGG